MPELLVADESYTFVPPHAGRLWPWLLRSLAPALLRRRFGVTKVEVRGGDKIRELIRARRGILLTPNHCRMADALVLQVLAREWGQPFFVMASSHLFRGNKLFAWMLHKMGAFSIHREGVDREAVKAAIDILTRGDRPLVIFPEGALSQANDHLNALMEGVSFIASAAARQLAKQSKEGGGDGGVVSVPIAIKYLFQGDLEQTIEPMLTRIEERLWWRPQQDLSLMERVYKLGHAILALKEIEYFGGEQVGALDERLDRLIDHLLSPLEDEWLGGTRQGSVISRVKDLRKAVLPAMIEEDLPDTERERRWRQLEDMGLAQQMSLYPPRYVASHPTVDRLLETVERIGEYLSGDEEKHPPMTVVVQVGEPIDVSPKRRKDSDGDALLAQIEAQLTGMLEGLAKESRVFEGSSGGTIDSVRSKASS